MRGRLRLAEWRAPQLTAPAAVREQIRILGADLLPRLRAALR